MPTNKKYWFSLVRRNFLLSLQKLTVSWLKPNESVSERKIGNKIRAVGINKKNLGMLSRISPQTFALIK